MNEQAKSALFILLGHADREGIFCSNCNVGMRGHELVGAVSIKDSNEEICESKAYCLTCALTLAPEIGWTTRVAASRTDACWNHLCRFSCGWEMVLGEIK